MYIYLENSVSLISMTTKFSIFIYCMEKTAKWQHTSINKFCVSLSKPRKACSQSFEHVCCAMLNQCSTENACTCACM